MADRLKAGQRLTAGKSIRSSNQQFKLYMQGDGNLVLYIAGSSRPIWAAGTHRHRADKAYMQGDGNFVLYRGNKPVWATGTQGNQGAYLLMQDNGDLVLRNRSGRRLWSTGTSQSHEKRFVVRECKYRWTARYTKTVNHIDVRIRLVPNFSISDQRLRTLKQTWEKGIVSKWSNQYKCQNSKMTVKVHWVDRSEHHTVILRKGPKRSNMLTWDDQDSGHAASHEFGHMLGMVDEYKSSNCPNRNPVSTGTVMAKSSGSVARRHINAICGSSRVTRGVRSGSLAMETGEKITLRPDDDAMIKLTLCISAGRAGQRLQYEIDVDEDANTLSMNYIDELANKKEKKKGLLSADFLHKVKEVLQAGRIPAAAAPIGSLLPGSIVGALTIQAGKDEYSIHFPVPENFEDKGLISTDSAFMRTAEGEDTEELMQMIIKESEQLKE